MNSERRKWLGGPRITDPQKREARFKKLSTGTLAWLINEQNKWLQICFEVGCLPERLPALVNQMNGHKDDIQLAEKILSKRNPRSVRRAKNRHKFTFDRSTPSF